MFFFSLILITGLVTTFTDLRNKKIYNNHLLISAILGLTALVYIMLNNGDIYCHLNNGILAFIVGIILYRFDLWRGGDAKLFTLYAFLMPQQAINQPMFGNTISLFVCSFITGMTILLPVFIKDILMHHKVIIDELTSPVKCQALFNAVERTITISWIVAPIFHYFKFSNSIVNLAVMFLIFTVKYKIRTLEKDFVVYFIKRNSLRILASLSLGFLMRLWLTPHALTISSLTQYLTMTTLYITSSVFIYSLLNFFKSYQDRVPFAPLLFAGCLLTYTPFNKWVTHFIRG